MSKKRVVVTGLGVVSSFGNDVDVFYNCLLEGKSAVRTITSFPTEGLSTRFAAWIPPFEVEHYLDKKLARRADPFITYAMIAAKKALEMGKWDYKLPNKNPDRCGVLIGSGMGGLKTFHEGAIELQKEKKRLTPFFIPYIIPNMAGALVAIDINFCGPNYSISTACATGNYCIVSALNHIRSGQADVMLCGGTEAAINIVGLTGFIANRALSERNDEPEKASRPWDRDRDGFVMGEGAGILLIESLEHALERKAPIIAEVLGGSINCDAYHMTAPRDDGLGVYSCINAAIHDAGIDKSRVNYINAHGTSTPLGDMAEVLALKSYFGKQMQSIKMNSTKSLIGHCLGAAGGIEAVTTVQAIKTGMLHPTLNLENPMAEVEGFDLVPLKSQKHEIDVALSNSFGFGGHNSSLVLARYQD